MKAEVKKASVEGCSQKEVELDVKEVWLISASEPQLPLQIEDASRKIDQEESSELNIKVNQDTRLDNRILDLRTPTNQAIFKIEAGVCSLFR